jgi:hypothetical protein
MTPGESLFEKYLETQGLTFSFEKEHVGKSKQPDYTLEWQGKTIIFDVNLGEGNFGAVRVAILYSACFWIAPC